MGRLFGWLSLVVLALAACSGDQLSAPGACPQFCAAVNVQAVDTILRASIERDSTYTGYVPAHSAGQIMVASPGSMIESRAVFKFAAFKDTIVLNLGDTVVRPVVQTDSFRIMLVLNRQTTGVTDKRYALYRLPRAVDSTTTYAQLAPYFSDSTFIREVPVQDSSASDSIFIAFDPIAVPNFVADSEYVTIGVALRSSTPSFIELGSNEGLKGAVMARFVKVDSVPGTRVIREDDRGATLDTYIFPPPPPPTATQLVIGSAPSSRAIIRLNLPTQIVDSSNVVRATLLLVPALPVIAAPGDTLRIIPNALATDIGPKSPVLVTAVDSAGRIGAKAFSGLTDTIRVDITDVVRSWKTDTLPSRVVALRLDREGGSFGQVTFWSTADPLRKPVVDITFVPPVKYEGR